MPFQGDLQTGVEKRVEPDSPDDVLFAESKNFENLGIGFEENFCAVGFGLLSFLLRLELSSFEVSAEKLAIPVTRNRKTGGERVDCLGADTVQSDAELKDVVIVFRSGVDPRNAVDHFAERNAAAVIADADESAIDCHIDLATVAHDEFVDRIVDHLLQKDIDAVIVMRAIAQTPDVHPGTSPNVFQRGKRFDLTFVVIVLLLSGTCGRRRVGVVACRRVGVAGAVVEWWSGESGMVDCRVME